jgi:hypothetical protein
MHQYIINVPMLRKVFTYAEYRDRKTKPRDLETEYHNQYDIEDGNPAPQVIPLEAIRSFNAEEGFYFFHYISPILLAKARE